MKDRPYLSRVRKLSCMVRNHACMGPVQAHHKTGAGMALKASDHETMPLCVYHHTGASFGHCVHNGTKTFERNYLTQDEMIEKTHMLLGYSKEEFNI